MQEALEVLKDFGGLGLAAVIIWYFLSNIAPKMQQDHKELLSNLIDRHDRKLDDIQSRAIETLKENQNRAIEVSKENRELFLMALQQQRMDFTVALEKGWQTISRLERIIDEHASKAELVWTAYGLLHPEIKLKEQPKKESIIVEA